MPKRPAGEGIALHALLQHLLQAGAGAWHEVGSRRCGMLLPEAPESHAGSRQGHLHPRRPELAHLFGPDSRAEVPFLADGAAQRAAGDASPAASIGWW
jgi:ATP-dependent helicase/nuclease subunit A